MSHRDHGKRFLSFLVSGFTCLCSPRSVAVGRDSAVGITTSYGLDGPGIESRWGDEIFCIRTDRPWPPPSLLYDGHRVFPGIMRPGREHSHFIILGNYNATCFDCRLVILRPILVDCVTRCYAQFGIPSCLHPRNTSN